MGTSNWFAKDIADVSEESRSRIHTSAANEANANLERFMKEGGFSEYKLSLNDDRAALERTTPEGVRIVDVSGWWIAFLKVAESKERERLRVLLVTRPEDI